LKRKNQTKSTRLGFAVLGLATALVFSFASTILVLVGQQAEATHLYGNMRWSSYVAGPICISPTMANTNIGLTASSNALFTAYDSINRLDSRYVIKQMGYTGDCRSHIYGQSLFYKTLGVVQIGRSSSTIIVYEDMLVNTGIRWESSNCHQGPYGTPVRMSFLMRHEFSHYIFLKHNTVDDRTSITHPNFYCSAWDAFNSHDAGTVRAVYG
jgi:hypothetical protein